jgi:hypothetical protein
VGAARRVVPQDNQLIVRAWVPGIDQATVDVQVSGNLLAIRGERTFPYRLKDDPRSSAPWPRGGLRPRGHVFC